VPPVARRRRPGVACALALTLVSACMSTTIAAPASAVAPGPDVVTVGPAIDAGDLEGLALHAPVVGMASTPSGLGYWMVASDGGIFAFGDAGFFGSMGGIPLNRPVVGMAATPTGQGYWLVASDGGIFSFGDARFFGSMGATPLNQPVVGIVPTPTGRGYRLVAADGGVFAFGDAPFIGSLGATPPADPVVALATTFGGGYSVLTRAGVVVGFGDAPSGTVAAPAAVALLAVGTGLVVVTGDGRLVPVTPMVPPVPPDLTGRRVVAAAATPDGTSIRLATVPDTITLVAGGDVHGEGRVHALLDRGGDPLSAVADVVGAADVAVVNLETAVGSSGSPEAKEFTFQADPALVRSLARSGVDVVNLANNHARDFGTGALLETFAHVDAAGLVRVGAGGDAADAYAPRLVATPSGTVAFVGLTQVLSPGWAATATQPGLASGHDRAAAVDAVRSAAAMADSVVVTVHWGVELDRCASTAQRDLAHALVAAGADVILGSHPHVLQGIDRIDGALVAYSLGNLVWYHSRLPSAQTALLHVTLQSGTVTAYDVMPVVIDGDGRPVPVGGQVADDIRGATVAFRPGAGICPA
jgi:poly-gamma-glutamate capsule biosynthesis protein CapA/YwtB (metallophosphatase superfamily)